jgi:hypothetical protein
MKYGQPQSFYQPNQYGGSGWGGGYGVDPQLASNIYSYNTAAANNMRDNLVNSGNSMLNYQSNLYHDNTLGNMNWLDNYVRSLGQNQQYDLGKLQNDTARYGIDQGLAGQKYGWDAQTGMNRYQWDTQRGINDVTQAAETDRNRYGWDSQLGIASTNIKPQMLGVENQQKRFDTLLPLVQQMLGGAMGGAGMGALGDTPNIDTNPVYSQDMIDQNVNNIMARGMQSAAGQQRNLSMNPNLGQSAKAGLGLRAAALARGDATNQALNFRTTAAQQNAQQMLAAQIAKANAARDWQGLGIQRYGAQTNRISPYLALLGGLA